MSKRESARKGYRKRRTEKKRDGRGGERKSGKNLVRYATLVYSLAECCIIRTFVRNSRAFHFRVRSRFVFWHDFSRGRRGCVPSSFRCVTYIATRELCFFYPWRTFALDLGIVISKNEKHSLFPNVLSHDLSFFIEHSNLLRKLIKFFKTTKNYRFFSSFQNHFIINDFCFEFQWKSQSFAFSRQIPGFLHHPIALRIVMWCNEAADPFWTFASFAQVYIMDNFHFNDSAMFVDLVGPGSWGVLILAEHVFSKGIFTRSNKVAQLHKTVGSISSEQNSRHSKLCSLYEFFVIPLSSLGDKNFR